MRSFFLSCLVSFFAIQGMIMHAQEVRINSIEFSTLEIEMLDISDGLSQGMINSVAQDHTGYIWIATKDGLNRYDGVKMKVYRHNPNDSLSISENFIRHVQVDPQGRIWVSTQTKGLNLYNPETDGFVRFRNDPSNPHSLMSDMTHRTFSSPQGDLFVWATDKKELSVLPAASIGTTATGAAFENPCARYPVFSSENGCWFEKQFSAIGRSKDATCFSGDGTLWIFNGTDSVFGYNEESLAGRAAPIGLRAVNTMLASNNDQIACLILNEHNGNLHLTDGEQNLWRYDPDAGELILHVRLPDEYSFSGMVMFDSKGRIWVNVDASTLYRIDPSKELLEVLHLAGEWINGDVASPMIEDSFGNVWVPTGGYGLGKINSRKEKFTRISFQRLPDARAHHWPFRTSTPDQWHTFDKEAHDKWMTCANPAFLNWRYPDIHNIESHLTADGDGRFWFVISSNLNRPEAELISFDCDALVTETHSVFSMVDPNSAHLFLPIFFCRSGNLWCAHQSDRGEAILHRVNTTTGKEDVFPFPVDAGPVHYRFISDWWQDEHNRWWLATVRGVFRFNPETEEWLHFDEDGEQGKVLSGNTALSICPDPREPEKYIWVGTEGGGLNRIDMTTGEILHLNTENGLPNDVIYGILPDHRANLWLSTNYGLCMFNPQTFEVRNFTESDGLNGNEFNRYQFSKAPDGTLYFGGVKGVTAFHPEALYGDSLESELVFNGLRILNKPVAFSAGSADTDPQWLPGPIESCTELVFPYDVGTITLSYALLDFTVPEQNRFRYKMEGQDQDWIEGGLSTEATYTNLSPGHYRFRVSGLNSNNRWSEERVMNIRILPPWWGSWWFRILTVLMLALFLYGFYRYRLTQAVQIERMRNRIAQDLHDEIGSTLSSISLFSEVLKNADKNLSERSQSLLEKISDSSSEMMESMNDIVWTIKADNDRFEEVLNRMRAFAVNTTECRGIQLEFFVHEEAEDLNLNMELRKNFYLIFKEALNNAIKYANPSKIKIDVSVQQKKLQMTIQDNGSGFDQQAVLKDRTLMGGNGVRGMHARASKIGAELIIESILSEGTTVSLAVAMSKSMKPKSEIL